MRTQVKSWKRLDGRILVAGMALLLAPLGAWAQGVCTVNATTDTGNGSGSGGVYSGDILYCQRQASMATSNFTINFASSLNGQTITLSQPVGLGLFNPNATITVQGPGPSLLTISGGGSSSVGSLFVVAGSVAISGLTIANGSSVIDPHTNCRDGGGAICNLGAVLTVTNCAISGNAAGNSGGGGISNFFGSVTVIDSTFSGNTSTSEGGAILNNDGVNNSLTVTNSTFSGNTAPTGGAVGNFDGQVSVTGSTFSGNTAMNCGAVWSDESHGGFLTVISSTFSGNSGLEGGGAICVSSGPLTVINSTLSGNTSFVGSGINGNGAPVTLTNSIVAGNIPIPGAETSSGDPLDDCFLCGTQSSNNLISTQANPVNPRLSPLGNYGGPTQTMIPLPGSPALNAGQLEQGGPTTDQRGFPLPNSGNITLGAVQVQVLTVTTTVDQVDTNPGCISATGNPCSLRDALTAAQVAANNSPVIGFAVTGTITLNTPLPAITGYVILVGPGAGSLTISGGGSSSVGRIFNINSGALAVISGLTIANGSGGGISNSGSLTVTNSTLSGNTAPAGEGGGISNSGSLTLANSTFSGNTTPGNGGGIFNAGSMTVTNSTVSGNTALAGGGIFNAGSLTVTNSIVAGNTTTGNPGDDCDSCGVQSSLNLISSPGNIINPQLSPLGYYGGPTQTILPLPGSPAICLGSPALAGGLDQPVRAAVSFTTDQRGFPRLNTTYAGYFTYMPCLDAGAVQTNYQSVQFTNAGNSGYSGLSNTPVNTPAAPIVSVTENGQNIGGVPVTLSFNGNGTATGLGPMTTVAGAGATFPAVTVNAGGSDSLSVTLNITSLNPVSITSGSVALNIISPATTTIVSASPNSPTYGQPVTFLAAVSSGSSIPTGSVSFTIDGGTPVAGSALSACSGAPANTSCSTYTASSLNAGTHMVVATYAPTGSFLGSTGNTTMTVNKATATLTLGNLTVTYSGSPQSPTVTTTPPGLSASLSGAPDTNPGSYSVTATINDPNYTGSASGAFVINFTASAPPSGIACNGAYNGKFSGDLSVSAGQNCYLAGSVTGSINQTGGRLILSGASVGGSVQIQGGAFSFGPSTTIQGNLQIQGLPASTTQNAVCGVTVNGLLQYQNNAAPVEIGGDSPCSGNKVAGNLLVQNNTAAVTVSDNKVTGNLQVLGNNAAVIASTNTVGNNMLVQNNTGSSQVFNDVVTNNLQCSGNTSITGGGDKAGQLQGQCASF